MEVKASSPTRAASSLYCLTSFSFLFSPLLVSCSSPSSVRVRSNYSFVRPFVSPVNIREDLEVPHLLRKRRKHSSSLPPSFPFWSVSLLSTLSSSSSSGGTQDTDAGRLYLLMADTDSLLLPARMHGYRHTHATSNPTSTSLSASSKTRCLTSWMKLQKAGKAGPLLASILPEYHPFSSS